jgi:3-deoxy-D-arabino-heptulosonate 7-phosphate (DAHP) synthase
MKIYSKEGYILTNGNVYGYIIDLGSKDSETNYHEIPIEEYKEILKEKEMKFEEVDK